MAERRFLTDATALQEGLSLGRVGIWRWKIDADILYWTENLEAVHDLPPGSFDGTLASFQRDLHPEDAPIVWTKIKAAIDTGEPYQAMYRTRPRDGARVLWIETSGGVVTDFDGARYLTGACLDVTEREMAKQEIERRLRQQRVIAAFGTFALTETSLQVVLDEAVKVAAETLAVPLSKILQFADTGDRLLLRSGIGWEEGLIGRAHVGIDSESQAGHTLLVNEPVIVKDLREEQRFSGPRLLHDHQVRSGISVVIPGLESRPLGVFGVHSRELRNFDEADAEFLSSLANIVAGAARHSAAADHRLLLVREMAHRSGNMLQLVNSIASQTFKSAINSKEALSSFSERLGSLSRANYVVAQGGWTSTRFESVVRETLKPFADRLVMSGRDLLLPPELSFDLGLVLHELATNSAKYGGLGEDDRGVAVRISWFSKLRSDGGTRFVVTWEDPVASRQPPTHGGGFGSRLIAALVEQKWKGALHVSCENALYRVLIDIPLPKADMDH
jgi:two-component sensor histidine kinase